MIAVMVLNVYPIESKRRKHKDLQTENAMATSIQASALTSSMTYLTMSAEKIAIDIESQFVAESEHEHHRMRTRKYSIKEDGEVGVELNNKETNSKGATSFPPTYFQTTSSTAVTKSGKNQKSSARSSSKSNKRSKGKATSPSSDDDDGFRSPRCNPDRYNTCCGDNPPSDGDMQEKCIKWRCSPCHPRSDVGLLYNHTMP